MGKLFGTDGVRGVANQQLKPELAYKLGRNGAHVLTKGVSNPSIIIGRDTRISGELLESAMIAGILSIGVNVIKVDVITTPGLAYLVKKLNADAGVMISASHNSFEDNGIKFFGSDGYKLLDETELEIENLLNIENDVLPRPTGIDVGRIFERAGAINLYSEHLKNTINNSLTDMKIIIDTANGAAFEIAPKVFQELGANVITLNNTPDGININNNCGSTHPEGLIESVLEHKADIGLAYDGDADRLIAVDENGSIIDGDYIMSVCAHYLLEKNQLKGNSLVSTVMSNMGLYKATEKIGINNVQTKVGDRYVIEVMREKGYNLGGEQSGHIIFLEYNTTGDGILSSLQLVNVMQEKKIPLSQLAMIMTKYPQVLENVYVNDKSKFSNNEKINQTINDVKNKLGSDGRVLVRPSGTESLIRVMIEGLDEAVLNDYVKMIVNVIKHELD